MSAISLKSISGITSITTPAGVDNQLTLHNNNTTEAVKLDIAGNLHFHNHLNITGVSTASNFKTGTSNLHNTGLNVQDLDVDGHTNLDNVSVAGITTFSDDVQLTVANGNGILLDKSANQFLINSGTYVRFQNNNEVNTDDGKIGTALFASGLNIVGSQTGSGLGRQIRLYGNLSTDNIRPTADSTFSIGTSSNRFLHAYLDNIDVDGHTNLDNVSVAGVTTFTGNANFGSNGLISSAANFSLSSNKLRVTGSDTVGIEVQRSSNATIQCTETTNNTDLQLRANATGGLVRTASNTALNLGTFQKNRIQITNDGKVQIGLPGSSTSLPGAVEVVNIRAMTDGNLHIRAIGNISGAPSGSGVGIDVLNDANNAVKDLALRGSTVIFKGASAETLRISSDGNIGINDTAPPNFTGYKSLSIHGSTGGALVFGDDGTDEWETYGGDGVFKIYDRAATTTRLHLDGSYGRFGINTSSFSDTSTALSLKNGVAGNDHTILDIICNDNQTCRLTFSEDSNSSKGSIRYYYTGDANYMSFYTNGGASSNERLRINSNGSLNIGGTYTGTTHKLQVDNGTTHFKGRVFIRGTMSFNSTPFGANVTYDTGISVNAGGYGGSILAICSRNYGAGTNTQSGVYLIKFHYDGNNTPSITLIGGTNLATFGQSGSNTLTVVMGASNNMFTAIESSVVPTT